VENPLAFGIVIARRETGRIERFLEKPTWGEVFSDTINTGIYILEPEALRRVPHGRTSTSRRTCIPQMLREGAGLYGYVAQGVLARHRQHRRVPHAHRDVLRAAWPRTSPAERHDLENGTLWLDAARIRRRA
jgi:mannose-1-phosphate guanylyltransferase / phosphomannomutase